ncbi:hypothetical protein C1H46_008525 [Malus baccata]|uniref:RING-CH-type domain-containing protein n=1 Tax=Malus baccata TaxID=106549 RepID=A0A540N464_MALBA|nr:hypothetical protein C1H46_008525 [Malus baccata]
MSAPEITHHRRSATGGRVASILDDSDEEVDWSMEEGGGGTDPASEVPIDLGCSCKGDLDAAHKQCAETWFKIKGDK